MRLMRAQLVLILIAVSTLFWYIAQTRLVHEIPQLLYVAGVALAIPFLSAASILFLTFFALKQVGDGRIRIRASSKYGKVFLAVNRSFNKNRFWGQESLCRTFWLTNLSLLMVSFITAIIALVVTLIVGGIMHWKQSLLFIGAVALGIVILVALCAGAKWFWGKLEKHFPTFISILEKIARGALATFLICVCLGLLGFGLYGAYAFIRWIGPLTLVMWVIGSLASILLIMYVAARLRKKVPSVKNEVRETQFGAAVEQWYHKACPRIEVVE